MLLLSDIDECDPASGDNYVTCARNAHCVNIPGLWKCECDDGFEGDPNNYGCFNGKYLFDIINEFLRYLFNICCGNTISVNLDVISLMCSIMMENGKMEYVVQCFTCRAVVQYTVAT